MDIALLVPQITWSDRVNPNFNGTTFNETTTNTIIQKLDKAVPISLIKPS